MNIFFIFILLSFSPTSWAASKGLLSSDYLMPLLMVTTLGLCLLMVNFLRKKRASQQRQYDVLEFAGQPMFITKNNGDIIYLNEAAIKLVAFSLTQAKAKTIFDVVDGLPECPLNNINCQNIKKSQFCHCTQLSPEANEFNLLSSKGISIPVSVSILRQQNGDFVYYLTELSIQRKLEKQLELQNKSATIGEFLAGVLHEIGNPMAAIEGISADLLWQAENNEKFSLEQIKSQLNLIQTQAIRVNQIKNEFSQISGIGKDDGRQWLDLSNLLKQLMDLAGFDKRSHNIAIKLNATAGLPAIHTHEGKLTQILLNLFSNAMDALQNQADAFIAINVIFDESYLTLSIEDNGPGINSALLDKIFEPFYTTKMNGTGLGLNISKRLSESLDIKFEINSEIGRSTSVQLYIPTSLGQT